MEAPSDAIELVWLARVLWRGRRAIFLFAVLCIIAGSSVNLLWSWTIW